MNVHKKFAAALVLLATFVMAPNAHAALIFKFSFENTEGNTPGTVSGRIFGLEDNMDDQSATSIILDEFPGGLGGVADAGFDVVLWANVFVNSFNVFNGEITFGRVAVQNPGGDTFALFNPYISGCCGTVNNALSLDNGQTVTANTGEFAGVTYTNVSEVPLPAALPLFLAGLAGLGFARRKRAA